MNRLDLGSVAGFNRSTVEGIEVMAHQNRPDQRPIVKAVSFDEAGAAIRRLIEIARADTGQSSKVADFLLAWWNGMDNGHFPILHLCNVDAVIAEDMLAIMAYLSANSTVYADAWGCGPAMAELFHQWRETDQ